MNEEKKSSKVHNGKKIAIAIFLTVIIISASFYLAYYSGDFKNKNTQKAPGPYVALRAYGNNGSSVSPIEGNLSVDLSVWVPYVNGNGTTINLNNSVVAWNQVLSVGTNFTKVVNAWKAFMDNKTGEPTMSLIVTHTSLNYSNHSRLNIYEYYTNIPFDPYSANLSSLVFVSNFTLDLMHPFTTVPISVSNTSTPSVPLNHPLGVIEPGPCPPGDTQTIWTKTINETGWYPINIINATGEPSNEELLLSWTTASFSAKFEFTGDTSTNESILSSSNGYETNNLLFNTSTYQVGGISGYYDLIFMPNTTVTWQIGKEYFYEPDGSNCEEIGWSHVSILKVQYTKASSMIVGGLPYSTKQAANGTTYGNATFDEEWVRAMAYAFSYKYDHLDLQFNISAGGKKTIYNFSIEASSNYGAITNTFKDEGAIAASIATTGLAIAVMAAAASAFPGGATAGTLAEIGLIASALGWVDSIVNLATTFTLVVYTGGSLQTMTATNQIVNLNNPWSSIEVSMYDTGGNTHFSTTNGTESYVARTPYENVTT